MSAITSAGFVDLEGSHIVPGAILELPFLGGTPVNALLDATDTPDVAELLALIPTLGLLDATDPQDVAELLAVALVGARFDATDTPDVAELLASVLVRGTLDVTDPRDVCGMLLSNLPQTREVAIVHRTIPVPPARVGQTEWAEQHTVIDGSLHIMATAGLEARLPLRGAGSPEGNVVANRGRMYLRTDGGVGSTLYVKEANDGTATGWAAK